MRILSQDGLIFNDIPYEKFVFGILRDRTTNKFFIVARKRMISESGFKLNDVVAEYSTESKARKAMEMLREAYVSHVMYKIMDQKQRALFLANVSEDEQSYLYGVFQFQQDNEIEI